MTVSDRRKCQFAYVIFQKSRAFRLTNKWNDCAPGNETYERMKDFICNESSSLEKVAALTIQDSLNQVEMLKAIQKE